jgi:hypothetical protein
LLFDAKLAMSVKLKQINAKNLIFIK